MNFVVAATLIVAQVTLIRADYLYYECARYPPFRNYHFDDYPSIFQMISNAKQVAHSPDLDNIGGGQIVEDLTNFTDKVLIGDLTKALSSNDYKTLSLISDQIHSNAPKSFGPVFKAALTCSFDDVNIDSFLKSFNGDKHPMQSAHAYSAFIQELQSRDNGSVALTLTFNFKRAYDKLCSTSSPTRDCDEAKSLLKLLPVAFRNIVSQPVLCLQAKANSEFLYSGDAAPTTESRERRLKTLTKRSDGELRNVSWVVEPYKDALHIKSFDSNEYIFITQDYYDFDKNRAKVELRNLPTIYKKFDFNSEWVFEPSDDTYLYIKNPGLRTYLYVNSNADASDAKNEGYVFMSHDKFEKSLWRIYAC